MVSLLPNLSSPISRLSLLWRPSLHFTIKSTTKLQFQLHEKAVKPQWFKSFSPYCSVSNLSMGQTQKQMLVENENLVVLGIETSCDDTAAAVVSFFLKKHVLVVSLEFILWTKGRKLA